MIFTNIPNKKKIFGFLFFLIPFTFIAGNLVVNLNFLIISLYGLVVYKKEFTAFTMDLTKRYIEINASYRS